jgi:hypothetical protein
MKKETREFREAVEIEVEHALDGGMLLPLETEHFLDVMYDSYGNQLTKAVNKRLKEIEAMEER